MAPNKYILLCLSFMMFLSLQAIAEERIPITEKEAEALVLLYLPKRLKHYSSFENYPGLGANFIGFELLVDIPGQESQGGSGWFGVNQWTGDVWDLESCKPVHARKLDAKLNNFKKFNAKRRNFERLHALRPKCE